MVTVEIPVGEAAELQLMRDPRATLAPDQIETLVQELLAMIRTGFGNERLTERQTALSTIDVPYGVSLRVAGTLMGQATAWLFTIEAVPGPVLYLGGSILASQVQGRGYYQALLLSRFALGAAAGARHFTTRTQSPVVCRTLKRYRPYPITPGTDHYRGMARQIAVELDGHGPVNPRPGGLRFDERTGVMHETYGRSLYGTVPWSDDPAIDGYIKAHLSIDQGDALVLVGPLDAAQLDANCRRKLGLGFSDLTACVAPLVLGT